MLCAIKDKGGKIKPTHLMYDANLSHKQLKKYVSELKKKGFVSEEPDDDSKLFVLERKGFVYISKIKEMREFEDTFGL